MNVDALKISFSNYRYKNLLEEFYFIKTNIVKSDSSKQLDNWILIDLLENKNNVNLDKIKQI